MQRKRSDPVGDDGAAGGRREELGRPLVAATLLLEAAWLGALGVVLTRLLS